LRKREVVPMDVEGSDAHVRVDFVALHPREFDLQECCMWTLYSGSRDVWHIDTILKRAWDLVKVEKSIGKKIVWDAWSVLCIMI